MYTPLGEGRLKTGERLHLGVVAAPDDDWLPALIPFLGHKSADFRAHVRQALEGPLDGLSTCFYVGTVDGRLVCQAMVVGGGGVGIVGHVRTLPEERRKGACSQVFSRLMEDSPRRGYRVLCLSTGFETPPYRIYHRFGFRPVAPGSGCMKWAAEAGAEQALLHPGPPRVRELRWGDWGAADLLAMQPEAAGEEQPRCLTWGIRVQGSAEGPFVSFMERRAREPRIQAQALESASGVMAGWALLAPDPRWFGDVWLLDLYALPAFRHRLPELLEALSWPEAPVTAYSSDPEGPRAAALRGAGLRRMATFPGWLCGTGARRPVGLWRR